jgi:hypothetical protein
MEFASSSSRFSREEDEEEEQEEEEEEEEASPREIPFMTAAATADTGAAASSSSPSAAASSGPAAAPRSSDGAGASGSGGGGSDDVQVIEKEHMFDKVVTPSDVGKLNRLVIPKQHAEKYFPLDAAANEKGLLLSFEDRAGKLWRFRYSYWNSSQSYVMTKGWSRFVKEKRLDAGDTVSFCRGAGDTARDRLFIDWKRRADSRDPHRMPRLPLPMAPVASPYGPWGGGGGGAGGFFMPPAPPATLYEHHRFRQALDFRNINAAAAPARQLLFFGSAGMPPRASMPQQQQPPPPPHPPLHSIMLVQPSPAPPTASVPMLLDSVPLVNSPTAASKRVRLFGVNLDNPQPGTSAESSQDANALSLRTPGWQRPGPLRFFESPQRGAESSAASSPSSSSSSKREAHSSLDLDL